MVTGTEKYIQSVSKQEEYIYLVFLPPTKLLFNTEHSRASVLNSYERRKQKDKGREEDGYSPPILKGLQKEAVVFTTNTPLCGIAAISFFSIVTIVFGAFIHPGL